MDLHHVPEGLSLCHAAAQHWARCSHLCGRFWGALPRITNCKTIADGTPLTCSRTLWSILFCLLFSKFCMEINQKHSACLLPITDLADRAVTPKLSIHRHCFIGRSVCSTVCSAFCAGFAHTTPSTFSSTSETSFYLWGPSGSGVIKTSVCRPSNRIKTRWTQVRGKKRFYLKRPSCFYKALVTENFSICSCVNFDYIRELCRLFFLFIYTK